MKTLDEHMEAADRQSLYELHCLSDEEVYGLPQKLQCSELRRRIILAAKECKDPAVLEAVMAELRKGKV